MSGIAHSSGCVRSFFFYFFSLRLFVICLQFNTLSVFFAKCRTLDATGYVLRVWNVKKRKKEKIAAEQSSPVSYSFATNSISLKLLRLEFSRTCCVCMCDVWNAMTDYTMHGNRCTGTRGELTYFMQIETNRKCRQKGSEICYFSGKG